MKNGIEWWLNTYLSFSILDVFSYDSIEGSSAFVWNNSGVDLQAVSLLVLLNELLLLQLLQSPSDYFSAGVVMSFRSASSSLQSTVNVGQKSDSSVRSEVNFSGKRSNSGVDPVIVQWAQLVSWNYLIWYGWQFWRDQPKLVFRSNYSF